MHSAQFAILGALALVPAAPRTPPVAALQLSYKTYAAGLNVAAVRADLSLGPHSYELKLAYHTTGLVGFFDRGHQLDQVRGVWHDGRPDPLKYQTNGRWDGKNRTTVIAYQNGDPLIRAMVPPDRKERQPVPPRLRNHAIDTLSALVLLIRRVAEVGNCNVTVHTFDGRRATEVTAHTAEWDLLPHTSDSIYSGRALRCDFKGRMLAGFKLGENRPADHKPLRGSAWFAKALPGQPLVPVRMSFQTLWFGEATMYLTAAKSEAATQIAEH